MRTMLGKSASGECYMLLLSHDFICMILAESFFCMCDLRYKQSFACDTHETGKKAYRQLMAASFFQGPAVPLDQSLLCNNARHKGAIHKGVHRWKMLDLSSWQRPKGLQSKGAW